MFLSSLLQKRILVGKQSKGVCLGIGFSLKNQTVKYLLCGSAPHAKTADFAVGIHTVLSIDDSITLSRLRAVHPNACVKVFTGLPIYAHDGIKLGELQDIEIVQGKVIRILVNDGKSYPIAAIFAFGDAIILRKDLPFPLGQTLPKAAREIFPESGVSVTKNLLRSAIKKGKLIELTLSLPPFNIS